jgi:transposase InsO family protein
VVIDLYSRKIIGWSLAYNLRTQIVADALRQALGSRKSQSSTATAAASMAVLPIGRS